MAYEFIKLSEVPVTEFDADTGLQNAIIEEDGEIKRVPLHTIGGGSSGGGAGGYKYYYLYSGYLYETTSASSSPQSTDRANAVEQYAFADAYKNSPVMISFDGKYVAPLLNWYEASGGVYKLAHVNDGGNLITKEMYFKTSN